MFRLSSIRKQNFFSWTQKIHIYLSLHGKEASTSGRVSLNIFALSQPLKICKNHITVHSYPLQKHQLSPSVFKKWAKDSTVVENFTKG